MSDKSKITKIPQSTNPKTFYYDARNLSCISDRVLKVWGLKDCETLVFKK
jgi:hypothetical protein